MTNSQTTKMIIGAIGAVLLVMALESSRLTAKASKVPNSQRATYEAQAMELWDACGGERVITMTVSESGGLTTTVNCFTNGGE